MNEKIKQLLLLQEKDLVIDRLDEEIESFPLQIKSVEDEIEEEKKKFEDYKKENNQKLLLKKQKEGDLEKKEAEISKHNQELNTVKTNEAYRAILKDIDRLKLEKNQLEEGILQLMDDLDSFNRDLKNRQVQLQVVEGQKRAAIGSLNDKLSSAKQQREAKLTEREEFVKTVPEVSIERYLYIRNAKKGSAIVPLEGETCGGCRMRLPQHVITQIIIGSDIVICEECSRILYADKSAAANAKPA